MTPREKAKKLLALLRRIQDENPGVSPETYSAYFVREALADPDLQHIPGDVVLKVFLEEIEAKRK